jgi:hypothetical protein
MVASYFGVTKKSTGNINEAAEFVPVDTLPQAQFDALLQDFGITAPQ